MALGRALSGSEVKYIQALSPTAIATSALFVYGTAMNLGGDYNWMDLIVNSSGANAVVNVQHAATSAGSYVNTGLSLTTPGSDVSVRSMPLNNKNIWYRVGRRAPGGSPVAGVTVKLQQPRRTPIEQHSTTTVFSTVLP